MQYNTIEEAQAYMDGVVATREEITKMINLEMNKRSEPPLAIKSWTNFLVKMINRNDKSEEQVLQEATQEYLNELGADSPEDLIRGLMEALQERFGIDEDDDEE